MEQAALFSIALFVNPVMDERLDPVCCPTGEKPGYVVHIWGGSGVLSFREVGLDLPAQLLNPVFDLPASLHELVYQSG